LRQTLLAAAVDSIAEGGIAGLSLRECARRAGVSHAAPYRHFASKSELLWAIAAQGFAVLAAAGRRAMEGLTDPDARLDAYGAAYVRFAFEHPVHHRVMFTSDLEPPADAQPDDAFALLLEAAAASTPGARPELAALARWSLPHGLSMLILDGRVPPEVVRTGNEAEQLAREVIAHWRTTRPR
jgi:AcrR family transcriptional regulator